MMKAVVMTTAGGPEVLQVQERDIPTISADEVLIRVHAAGVNRPDVLQRLGKYPAPQGVVQDVLGLEVAGTIAAIGENEKELNLGDRVMALVAGGGYAEFVAAHSGVCIPLPESLTFEEAAAMPETIYTVWHNVFQRANLTKGERILIHGGAGGIGSTAILLSKLWGAEVATTVRGAAKKEFVKQLGADIIIDYSTSDFEMGLKDKGVDVVLDFIGGEYFEKNIHVLREEGRLVYINAMQGVKVTLNILKLMQKRLTITGSTLRNRDSAFKEALTADIKAHLLPLINERKLILPIYKVVPFVEASEAHRLMESSEILGKIVLSF